MAKVIEFRLRTVPQIPTEAHRMVERAVELIEEARRLMDVADQIADRAGVPKHGRATRTRPPVRAT